MYSTYPTIKHYSPATLDAVCRKTGLSVDQYRLGILKRAEVEIGNLIENPQQDLLPETVEMLRNLHEYIRCALGGE